MNDIDTRNENWIAGQWDDFGQFLAEKNFTACEAIQVQTGELGFENDALRMHQLLNKAEGLFTFEPVSQENIHTLRLEETDVEFVGMFPDLNRDERFLNSKEI